MENVLFKIAKIFREVKERHNLMNITLFEENEKEIENSVLNYIINLLIRGTPHISFKFFVELYIENIKFKNRLNINELNKLVLIRNCLDLLVTYNIDEFLELSMSICKNEDKDKILIILNEI